MELEKLDLEQFEAKILNKFPGANFGEFTSAIVNIEGLEFEIGQTLEGRWTAHRAKLKHPFGDDDAWVELERLGVFDWMEQAIGACQLKVLELQVLGAFQRIDGMEFDDARVVGFGPCEIATKDRKFVVFKDTGDLVCGCTFNGDCQVFSESVEALPKAILEYMRDECED